MVWCIEKLRRDVKRFKNVKPCLWNTLKKSKHFILQSKSDLNESNQSSNDLAGKSNSDSILVDYCHFCQQFPAINKCLMCSELKHRIVYTNTSLCVAKASSYTKMQYYWNAIQEEIEPMLHQTENESTDPPSPRSNRHLPGQIKTFFISKMHNGTEQNVKDKKQENLLQSCVIRQISARIKSDTIHKQGLAVLSEEFLRGIFPMFTELESVQICRLYKIF